MSDMAIHPSPTCETKGPFKPSLIVFTCVNPSRAAPVVRKQSVSKRGGHGEFRPESYNRWPCCGQQSSVRANPILATRARRAAKPGGAPPNCVTFFGDPVRCSLNTVALQPRRRMKKISVRAANGKYDVLCGRGVLRELPRAAARVRKEGAIFVISSPRVWRHWGTRVEESLGDARRATILIDDNETAKNLSTVERACRDLVRGGADRIALIVAVGGGVVGDVAGFVAASYARGIGLVHVPTTVVAQVDSALGGKTGVNLPEGKNLVGAFYPAEGRCWPIRDSLPACRRAISARGFTKSSSTA